MKKSTKISVLIATTVSLLISYTSLHAALTLHPAQLEWQPISVQEEASNTEFLMPLSAMGFDLTLSLRRSQLNKTALQWGTNQQALPLYLEGHVVGQSDSWVRLSVENGIPSGHLFMNGKLLRLETLEQAHELLGDLQQRTKTLSSLATDSAIEPLQQQLDNDITAANTQWVLFEPNLNELEKELHSSDAGQVIDQLHFAPSESHSSTLNSFTDSSSSEYLPSSELATTPNFRLFRDSSQTTTVDRAMRIGIVIDSHFNDYHNGRGLAKALSIINVVDGIYQAQLGLAIIVDSIKFYEDPLTDPLRNSPSDIQTLLDRFREDQESLSPEFIDLGLVHLFTGHRDPSNVIGLGWIDTICRVDHYNLSVSTPFPYDALLAAHEMGHNLGSFHDDEEACQLMNEEDPNTLMWARISGTTTSTFSSCSLQDMSHSKLASCNVDNIDLSLELSASTAESSLQRKLHLRINNNDSYRTATNVMSRSVFPSGTVFSEIPADCLAQNGELLCSHNDINAGGESQLSVLATLQTSGQQKVTSAIELSSIADSFDTDNQANIELLNAAEAINGDLPSEDPETATPSEPISTPTTTPSTTTPSTTTPSTTTPSTTTPSTTTPSTTTPSTTTPSGNSGGSASSDNKQSIFTGVFGWLEVLLFVAIVWIRRNSQGALGSLFGRKRSA